MTDYTVDDALNGLAAELDVQVSSQFAARVRTAVAAQRPAARPWGWGLAGLAAAACVAVGAVLMRPAVMPDVAPRPYVGAGFSRPNAGPAEAGPYEDRRSQSRIRADVRTVAGAPTEQALALNRLLLGLRSGRTHVSEGTPAPVDRDGLILTITPIEIPLIRIAPIEIPPLPAIVPLGPPEGQR